MKRIASFKDVFGTLYAVGACALTKTIKENPTLTKGYAAALRKTVEWMKKYPDKAAEMLSKSTGNKVSDKDFIVYLNSPMYDSYSQNADLKTHAASMLSFGAMTRAPKGPEDFYAYPGEAGAKW
jgi:ABC-type nitrate/sulfonate/bicarbonate transport system substrate-binding protein